MLHAQVFILCIIRVLSVLLFGVVSLKVPGASPSVAHHWAARSDCSKCWNRRRWVTVAFGGGGSCRRNTSCLQMWPAAGASGSQTATTRESLEIRVKTVAFTATQQHLIKGKPLYHIKTPTPERTRYGWNVEGLDLTTFSDLSSFCQTNPWLRVTFDHQLVSPYCLRQLTQKDVSHTLGCLYGLVLVRRTVCDKRASALYCSLSWSARCAAILPLRILCITSCINQYYTGRGDSVTEMCTLMADSLLTGLPSLVKPTGSFSETKAYNIPTTNFHPPLQLFIYLSIRVTFHFSLLFSAVFLSDPWSLLKEACGFLAACSFFFSYQHATILWLAYYGFFEASHLSKYLGEHQRPHITGG